jgi:hypothetical protein
VSYAYDAAGNTTSLGSRTITWDSDGHLTTISGGGTGQSRVYDADGNLLLIQDKTATTAASH